MKALLDILKPGQPEWLLAHEIDPQRLPKHIAIIMDGNGRWAQRRGLPRVAGHKAGTDAVRATLSAAARLQISAVTLYAFSIENWRRPQEEVELLWGLLRYCLRHEIKTLLDNNIRLGAIGRIDGLPDEARQELDRAIEMTRLNTGMVMNLAINYGGRAEILDAANRALAKAREEGRLDSFVLDEQTLAEHLYTADIPDPDLLIRTSGEMRISNFLLWQIAYTELYVTDTCWPDFRTADLLQAILAFQKRSRRFGGVDEVRGDNQRTPVNEAVGAAAS